MNRELIAKYTLFQKGNLENRINHYLKTDFFSEDQISEYQNKKLRKLIEHAYENVPYYREIFDKRNLLPKDIQAVDDLVKLPILEKSDIQEKYNKLVSKKIKDNVFTRTTSGSTGKPLTILFNSENKFIELALFYRFNRLIGNTFKNKQLLLWGGHASNFIDKIKSLIKQFIYNYDLIDTYTISDANLEKLAYKIAKDQYGNIRGYTSAVYLLAKKMNELGLTKKINSVSVSAEQLFDYYKTEIINSLGENLYDQYGCGETNSIAFECNFHQGMHQAFEHSVLEVVDNDFSKSETGHIVITNLDNFAMPLIRYRNGDLASISTEKCRCGRQSKLIKKIEGRSYDFIRGENGKIVHGGFFDDVLLDTGFTEKHRVKEIRIVQTKLDELTIEYVTKKNIPDDELDELRTLYRKNLGDMNILFRNVDKINSSKTGKRKFIVSYEEYKKGLI